MYLRFSVIKVLLFFTAIAYAQPQENIKGNAAFLFAYYPKEGQQSNFENGYKQHLKWHEEKNDPLPWYGWNVISGDRPGLFIDGTFGISYEALDNRVDKPGANEVFERLFDP